MPAFKQALGAMTKASGQKFDFIGFEMLCLMSQLPVAIMIEPYANYEIAAETVSHRLGLFIAPECTRR